MMSYMNTLRLSLAKNKKGGAELILPPLFDGLLHHL